VFNSGGKARGEGKELFSCKVDLLRGLCQALKDSGKNPERISDRGKNKRKKKAPEHGRLCNYREHGWMRETREKKKMKQRGGGGP